MRRRTEGAASVTRAGAQPTGGKNAGDVGGGHGGIGARRRAVQGYNADARPVGEPGNQLGTFQWPGTGQI